MNANLQVLASLLLLAGPHNAAWAGQDVAAPPAAAAPSQADPMQPSQHQDETCDTACQLEKITRKGGGGFGVAPAGRPPLDSDRGVERVPTDQLRLPQIMDKLYPAE